MKPVFNNKINEIVDMLKDKEDIVLDRQLDEAVIQITRRGVSVEPELDEDYLAEEVDNDTFIPADVNISQKILMYTI